MSKSNLQRGAEIITQAVATMPTSPGIYKMIAASGAILYVGKAKSLPKRVISYAAVEKLPYRLKMMVSQVERVEFLVTDTEAQALLLEANLIQTAAPRYNILLKDDKSFPYIIIEDKHQFPRITKYRGDKKKNNSYYGPFACVQAVNDTIAELQKVFKLRPCSDSYFAARSRPCLQYQLKRCSAPCVGKIDYDEYQASVGQAKNFLTGKNIALQSSLKLQMQHASEELEFEKAAEIRDRIKVLSQIQARNITTTGNLIDADIFALYQDDLGNCCIQVFFIRNSKNFGNKAYFVQSMGTPGITLEEFIMQFYQLHQPGPVILLSHLPEDKKSLEEALKAMNKKTKVIGISSSSQLKDLMEFAVDNARQSLLNTHRDLAKQQRNLQLLQQCFQLKKLPKLIEIYDNSHMQGSHAFGCYVAAEDGALNKKLYRSFRITSNQGKSGDDYAMLAETLTRRFKKLDLRPDLLIIDGGKGQLTYAMQTLQEIGWDDVEVVCMSKGPERNAGREFFHIIGKEAFQLPIGDQTLAYLHTLRNEAHRFAITTHRKSMLKSVNKSGIDAIPGIGKARKTALLSYFGSFDLLKGASEQDISRAPRISKKIAKMIVAYLHNDTND